MASVATGMFIAVNGIDLSGVLKTITTQGQADLLDSTTVDQTACRKYQKGLVTRSLNGEGFFVASATAALDANGLLQSAVTATASDYLCLFGRDGSTNGSLAEMYNFLHSTYDVSGTVGELVVATFDGTATKTDTSSFYGAGVFLMNQAATGAVNGTTYDTTSGGTGYLAQVHNLSGDGTATVKIQHSTNGSAWSDLIDFSTVTLNTAEQSASTATSVNRYVRAIVTAIGGTTATVAASIKVGYTG